MQTVTVVHGCEHPIEMNPNVHVFEVCVGENKAILLYPTLEQALTMRDTIDKIVERLKRAQADGVPLNPILKIGGTITLKTTSDVLEAARATLIRCSAAEDSDELRRMCAEVVADIELVQK